MLQHIRRNKKYSPKNKAGEDTQMKVEEVITAYILLHEQENWATNGSEKKDK